ncbi:DUF5819 family protein [Streptomyces sp. NPDC032472]|uniref:DUF5819 family protein n=1 Tax=Streptomyces sp. NPDC032472 TaxID=3155018 RepID=UPI0034103641
MKKHQQSDTSPAPRQCQEEADAPAGQAVAGFALKTGLHTAVFLCLATALIHVVLVFLHVAPPNPVSQRYSAQVNGWVFPLFEQNWRLFAPDPDPANRKILAKTAHTDSSGSMQVSPWFDLTAVDNSAVDHNVFPSHTAQNLLRRAWTAYDETHGGDDSARSERAVMLQEYLRNIAADRMAAHHNGGTFEFIQLQVVTLPIAAPGSAAGNHPPAPVQNRLLPWWKVTPHGK